MLECAQFQSKTDKWLQKRQKNTQYYHFSTLNKRPIDTWNCVHISSILVYLAFEFVNARFCLIIVIIHPALILPLTNFIYISLAQGFEGKMKMNQVHLIPTHFHLNIRTCLSDCLAGWLVGFASWFFVFKQKAHSFHSRYESAFLPFAIWHLRSLIPIIQFGFIWLCLPFAFYQ